MHDPVLPADPVEQHLTAVAEPVGELLAFADNTSSGIPNRCSASTKARYTAWWTAMSDTVRLGPAGDATAVAAEQCGPWSHGWLPPGTAAAAIQTS